MDKTLYLVLFLVIHILLVSGQDDMYGCPYKECECFMTRISCDNLRLEALPHLNTTQPNYNRYLSADSNLITTIPAGSLPAELLMISLMNNPITTIDEDAFNESSSSLETLSFSNAHFTRIPDAFLHLNALRNLNIHNTNITDWNIEAIKHIGPNMEMLYLENVGITTWPLWIQYFTHLSELNIIGSSFSSIPDDAFDNLAGSLKTLSLTNNSLTAVPKAVSKLNGLEMLNLINTKISNVTWLPSSVILSSLTIENASLSDAVHLSNALRPLANSLKIVHLRGNQLTTISNYSFMTNLTTVDLSHNRIYDPVSGSFPPALYEIDMSYNMLPAIPRILSNLTVLTYLTISGNSITALRGTDIPPSAVEVDVEFNLITELTDTSFPQHSQIFSITLSNNPITKMSEFAFQNLQRLEVLYLQNTKLTRLPLALASLSQLNYFDISGGHGLVCTCLEASLRPLILNIEELKGDCGEISIQFFYANLSPSCPTSRRDNPKS